VLLKDLKRNAPDLNVAVDPDGAVLVDGAIIGTLAGFAFAPDPAARAGEKRLLLAAAERRLAHELARRAATLAAAPDAEFMLDFDGRMPPRLLWRGARVATLRRGRHALDPRVELDRSLDALAAPARALAEARLKSWLAATIGRHLAPLAAVQALESGLSPAARGLCVQLVETLGVLPRLSVEGLLSALEREDRRALKAAGVRLGIVHVFITGALRPEPTRWRLALWAVHNRVAALPPPPAPGRVSLKVDSGAPPGFYAVAGFWAVEGLAVRVDMVDRTARAVHAQRLAERAGDGAVRPDPAIASALGLSPRDFARLMRALGFRDRDAGFAFVRRRPRQAAVPQATAFSRLQDLMGG
jgi:ATP-dependent RNA helicase SUPV3L1/SUV3